MPLPRGPQWARVKEEDESFVVSRPPTGDVGRDKAPRVSKCLEDEAQRAQVLPCLLDRDDVEAMDDLSDAAKVEEVTPRRVAFLRAPFLRDAAEGTDVPGCDEEISNELARRNGLVERRRGRGRMPTRGPAEAGW
jgi:hypothetical protein